jgi:dTDP-4-amino-4,6-dideoxy-D-galactose acyltransferase
MNYRVLEWDSRFFGMRVAQITVAGAVDSHDLLECLERSDAEVICVFLPTETAEQYRSVLEGSSGKFYDRKVTFGKQVDPAFAAWDPSIVETTTESDELLQLAYASGHLSRFFLDPGFNRHFKALYGEWIRKALREDDSKVFTLSDSRRMLGMVSVSVENGIGKIGLMAIDKDSRGAGLGMRLVKQCEAHYDSINASACSVVTQKDNIGACRLYQRAGYVIANEQDIWHVWKG